MHGRDIASSLHSAVKTDTQKEQRRRTWNRITRALPGRQRAGYEQQADAMYEIGLVLMYVMNLATGYAYTSLTELSRQRADAPDCCHIPVEYRLYGKSGRCHEA
ncbi:Uncharacterised protein [Klebsiella pneumoniae]|nr:Uncharacterised protein [Klebsiella pneumoniae]